METMKTTKFTATLGVCEGYGHDNDIGSKTVKEIVGKVRQDMAEKVFGKTGIYVSAGVTDSNMVYSKNRGCPDGGEKVAEISGTRNPEFCKDAEKWKQAVISVLTLAKDELKQTTSQVEFSDVDMVYIK